MMLYEHLGQTVAEGKQGSSDGFACFVVAICDFFLTFAEMSTSFAAEVAVCQQR